jgi:hypothetical protein
MRAAGPEAGQEGCFRKNVKETSEGSEDELFLMLIKGKLQAGRKNCSRDDPDEEKSAITGRERASRRYQN